MDTSKTYPVCEALVKNAGLHCATLVVTENFEKSVKGIPKFSQPSDELRNGTLTFVKFGNRVFGITCWHVIEYFRKQLANSGNQGSHSLRTMLNGFYVVTDRFIRPMPALGMAELDIGIREVHPDFPKTIGKIPFDIESNSGVAPDCIQFAYAVGYPETLKYKKNDGEFGYRISMPQVEILAEISSFPTQRFQLFSELDEAPLHTDYSGMSGGPIFWSTDKSYGLLGIVYEGGTGSAFSNNRTVHVFGELANPTLVKDWISQLPNCATSA
jgi:hypothetical protein